ncbi:hypothetical protein ACFE04_020350 [Oxalis oulophora]
MKACNFLLTCLLLSLTIIPIVLSQNQTQPTSKNINLNNFLGKIQQWKLSQTEAAVPMLLLAGILCFLAASISSAGGIGGGGLFVPILILVAGLDLQTATSFSAFMVTGGSITNVMCNMYSGKALIDYDIALLSEPCMLLGVSVGVICNLMFPQWLTTILFAVFLAWSTFKTCRNGFWYWNLESELAERSHNLENVVAKSESAKEPLLGGDGHKLMFPWKNLGFLLVIWVCFFAVYLIRGNKYRESILPIEKCGVGYWLISSIQIPLAIAFTAWILCREDCDKYQKPKHQDLEFSETCTQPNKLIFPLVALLAGIMGGVFGIGGGMLISPILLQLGVAPEVTAATCAFMVCFSSTMSALQYLLAGIQNVETALIFSVLCFVASLVGLMVIQKMVRKSGRASLIVFLISIVMALSTVLMTSFGAVDILRDYVSGNYMGFKRPC